MDLRQYFQSVCVGVPFTVDQMPVSGLARYGIYLLYLTSKIAETL